MTAGALNEGDQRGYYGMDDYKDVPKYDAHMHLNTYDESFVKHSEEDNFRLITINVDVPPDFPSIAQQEDFAIQQAERFPTSVYFASTFSAIGFNDPEWVENTLSQIKKSLTAGAIAVKVWKNIGMDLRDRLGNFVMVDDLRLDPIFHFLVENNVPLIGHLGEPMNCWLPLDQMTVQGDVDYFRTHPQYHMYLHPEYPSYEAQIEARDRMVKKHPQLQFIGAHLASLEWNTDELAIRLQKFPNMVVDTAERISHLQLQAVANWQKVYDFVIKYQDRIIYGTDIIVDNSRTPSEMKEHALEVRLRHWKFFTCDEIMEAPKVKGAFKGLKLPRTVVDKIYRLNAERCFPGLNPRRSTE